MDAQTKQLVQDSWTQVEPIADVAATLFYDRLFTLDPALRPLFPATDLGEQKKKLMQTLTIAVRSLDRLDQLVPALETLGRRHAGYGVQDAHYHTVGQALLWTLEQGLGDAFTPAVHDAWEETYGLVASVMQHAAAQVTAGSAPALAA
ncbi:globin family protein [Longimicrobium sp.]|uniref:globin family protein n=1 Tax=Longimicrobium sp. TaxID=2029185 RepID=UPI002E37929D|nr:globin family protein [Longimicrobium sp.]